MLTYIYLISDLHERLGLRGNWGETTSTGQGEGRKKGTIWILLIIQTKSPENGFAYNLL